MRESFAWIGAILVIAAAGGAIGAGVDLGTVTIAVAFGALVFWIARRMTRPEDKRWLVKLMMLGFVAKLAGSVARYLALVLVFGSGDATGYHSYAVGWAPFIRDFQWDAAIADLPNRGFGTNSTKIMVTLLYAIYTPSLLGGFVGLGCLSYLGQIGLYAAFRRWTDPSRWKPYAILLFFLPTLVFWPSSVGKDALMLAFIGLSALGISMVFDQFRVRHLLVATTGIALAVLVRPHVAMLLVGSAAIAVAVGKRPQESGAARRRWVVLVILAIALAIGAPRAAELLKVELTADGIDALLERQEDATAQGGSEVSGEVVRNPLQFPGAALRVLFRPLPHEANDAGTALSSIEGLALLALTIFFAPRMLKGLRSIRSNPYLTFSLTYTFGFVIAFSTVFNLGILARQRAQLFPMFLAVLIGLRETKPAVRSAKEQRTPATTPPRQKLAAAAKT
ncbi:MAG TPA: hypothetical protein VJR05_14825 [Acidimicrobiia bacterium]|nr:hypothetical protein [Acidimicrobiia bacterium]